MLTSLDSTFENQNIAFCIKNKARKISYQNTLCINICGSRQNKVCNIGCMELYCNDKTQQWQEYGCYVYKNTMVNKQFFDITVLASDDRLITFLQPLNLYHQQAMDFYKDKGLSKKEYEVITYVIQNQSNEEICQILQISKATLKTHLNKIYHKVRDCGLEPKYLPYKRR